MSREIKFRIWDKKYRTFDYNASPDIFISTDGEVYEKDERNWAMQSWIEYNKTDNYELSQYTGLKDKNGVEIYEGDIVRYITNSKEYLLVVKWNTLDACFDFGWVRTVYAINGEVVGNIYQHSELLERGE